MPARSLASLWHYGLHLSILVLILINYSPSQLEIHPVLLRNLLSGTQGSYKPLGAELAPFKAILPQKGVITFLMDKPRYGDKELTEFFLSVQNFLCPVILNSEPVEPHGIIYCTNDDIANARLSETGYQMVAKQSAGKGIMIRKRRT